MRCGEQKEKEGERAKRERTYTAVAATGIGVAGICFPGFGLAIEHARAPECKTAY